jgi:hypothetical protein
MKNTLLVTLLLLVSTTSFAGAPTLSDNMKALGKLFKAIALSVNDRGQNTANATNAGQMVTLFTAARAQVPDTITALPAPQQPAAIADYQRILDGEISFATQLKAAFAAGNNSAAAGLISQMDSSKRDGHTKYKKD